MCTQASTTCPIETVPHYLVMTSEAVFHVIAVLSGPSNPKVGDVVNVKLTCKTEDGEVSL